MSRVAINTGSVANDGTGDSLRIAGGKINDNFIQSSPSFIFAALNLFIAIKTYYIYF